MYFVDVSILAMATSGFRLENLGEKFSLLPSFG